MIPLKIVFITTTTTKKNGAYFFSFSPLPSFLFVCLMKATIFQSTLVERVKPGSTLRSGDLVLGFWEHFTGPREGFSQVLNEALLPERGIKNFVIVV